MFSIGLCIVAFILVQQGEAALETTYIGCFNDGNPKDLPDGTHLAHYMQLETCAALCAAKGFKYFGAQNGADCYCGDSYGDYGEADDCNTPCQGNPLEMCGKFAGQNIYSIDSMLPESEHIGCYQEQNDWFLQQAHYVGINYLTHDVCKAFCYQKGTAFFGIDHGAHCHCGNKYDVYGTSTNCNAQCTGDANLPNCGGFYATDVYLIKPAATLPETAHMFTLPSNGHHYILETTKHHHALEAQIYCKDTYGWNLAEIEDAETLDAVSKNLIALQDSLGVSFGEIGSGARAQLNLDKPIDVTELNAAGWNCATLVETEGVFSYVGRKCQEDRAILCEWVPGL